MKPRGNQYHILAKMPVQKPSKLPKNLEKMAHMLVSSGRLYINADDRRNFVHYTTPSGTVSISARELNDPAKRQHVQQMVQNSVPLGLGMVAVNQRIEQLEEELKRARGVDEATELRLARLLVQAAHPVVMAALLYERTQIFVSFSHNVGDLMAVHFWQSHGTAGGLQATEDDGTKVYVSCSGDPFFEGKEEEKYYKTDGFDALARLMVIAGQEMGHFADLRRSPNGIIGRHSASMQMRLAPTPACKAARDYDMAQLRKLEKTFIKTGGLSLWKIEDALAFYEKQRLKALGWYIRQPWRLWRYLRFMLRKPASLPRYLRTVPKLRYGTFYAAMFSDMMFNLAPDADAYKRPDPIEEEAIACIEALARVPQQVNKWGHEATKICWPKLYALYYGQVIPDLRASLPREINKLTQ